ncbi:hypothetical protein [uncultured Rhodospira sp.]|uniref:hypothetical protein n=1 Tax=uncultured Rhodospira sp. TaxID=1936189 RepID=UPI00263462AD|nr:hypothetical protein [uncultured Rhodospira sp.]
MDQTLDTRSEHFAAAVDAAARELVSCSTRGTASYVRLPLLYPDGSSVTVRIDPVEGGLRVSDNGFAFREIETVGAERSFARTAATIAKNEGVLVDRRKVFVDAPQDKLFRAICDVAAASWRIADRVYERLEDTELSEIEAQVKDRLSGVFGIGNVQTDAKVIGSSATEWDVTAVVNAGGHKAIFQAVNTHGTSIYKASTAFRDIAELENAPRLVAVVRNKEELGRKLLLISREGRVIEAGGAEEIFRKAAA